MDPNQLYLFKDKRFLPIFIVQFCGCLNDGIIKNSLIILITYKLSNILGQSSYSLVLLANTLFVIPFVIFASLAGQIADRYERSTIVKIIKLLEIFIVLFAVYGFTNNNLVILFLCVASMGIHSTFFGPIKYSVLPDHLKKNELLGANGFIEAGTFVSILFGTLIGGFYNFSATFVTVIAISISILGFVVSLFLPKSNNQNLDVKINFNILTESIEMIRYVKYKKQVYFAILGISWFWFIGAAILAQIPSLAKDTFGADENVANLFIAIFSIGVGCGSFLCNKIFKHEITTKYIFLAAVGISVFGIDLYFASGISAIKYEPEQLRSILYFLSKLHNLRILIDLFCIAAIGGFYVVPLYAVMQYFSIPAYRSRVVAACNLISSICMAGSTGILSLLFYFQYTIPAVILFVSLLNIVVAFYIFQLIPEIEIIPKKLLRGIFRLIFDSLYQVEVKGIENYHKAGKRTVIIANHLSYIDPALLAVYLPENLTFAINSIMSEVFWVKPFLKVVKALPIDPNNSMAIKTLINEVKKNKKIAIFPEGRISTTGSLMKIYEGPGMIADKADATILPIRIDGPQFTHFSKVNNILKTRIFTKVTITILPPVKFTPSPNFDSRERRKYISTALYNVMADMMFESSDYKKTLFQSLIDAAKIYGFNKVILQDVDNNSASYRSLLLKAFILSDLMSRETSAEEFVGLMLPNMVASTIAFYALQASGRIPTMINFTSGSANIILGCRTAMVKTVYSSKKFVKKAELEEVVDKIITAGIKIIYLEDLRTEVTFNIKLKALIASIFPNYYYQKICKIHKENKPAVTLFTSGTEGSPKAVILSHKNIQANKAQALAKIDFNQQDIALNALPMFHCFGLTGVIIMSLSGIKTYLHPSPLHYRIIPEMAYDVGATIMFSTDTFLNGYAKYAHPYDFYAMRYIFAGAEKLKAKTRQLWFDRYGVRILEGYGVTEASPIIAVNTPMHDRPGTVGRLMLKIDYFIQSVEGIAEGGRLFIKGPNIMLGYINADKPGNIKPPYEEKLGEGWYDTGDIVKIDEDGYITILGRAKRFAKIAGEMISLTVLEELALKIDPDNMHAVVCLEDERKGEQILLFTTSKIVTKETIAQASKIQSLPELFIPKIIIKINEIPLLPTGKTDYRKIIVLAKEYI